MYSQYNHYYQWSYIVGYNQMVRQGTRSSCHSIYFRFRCPFHSIYFRCPFLRTVHPGRVCSLLICKHQITKWNFESNNKKSNCKLKKNWIVSLNNKFVHNDLQLPKKINFIDTHFSCQIKLCINSINIMHIMIFLVIKLITLL